MPGAVDQLPTTSNTLLQALRSTLPPTSPPPHLHSHPHSATVYRAVFLGEVVAAKTIDIGRSREAREAFLTARGLGGELLWEWHYRVRVSDLFIACHPPPDALQRSTSAVRNLCVPPHTHPPTTLPLLQEAVRLHQLHHPHVVALLGVAITGSTGVVSAGSAMAGSPGVVSTCREWQSPGVVIAGTGVVSGGRAPAEEFGTVGGGSL